MSDLNVCVACASDIAWNAHACSLCAEPVIGEHQANTPCLQCSKHPPMLDSCHSALLYQSPCDQLLKQLKYHRQLHHARFFAAAIIRMQQLQACLNDSPDASLLAVPIHASRLRDRGFNQAQLICQALLKTFSEQQKQDVRSAQQTSHTLTLAGADLVQRVRATRPQHGLSKTERRANIKQSFACSRPVVGEDFIVIDDVMTSGETFNAIASCLKQAGANQVHAIAACRATL